MEESAVRAMKRGSIIIDLAGATGGNVVGSKPDEIVERDGVTIMAPTNLPATVPVHASQLYSRNVTSFLTLLIKDGELSQWAREHISEIPNEAVAHCESSIDKLRGHFYRLTVLCS